MPPICYENLINLDTVTTAITSPMSENGKRFWTAINMKKNGFNRENIAGYQYYEGKKFPYQFKNSEDVPGYVKIKDFAYTRNQTQSFKAQVSGMSRFILSKIKLQKHPTVDRANIKQNRIDENSIDQIVDKSNEIDIHNLVDPPEMVLPQQLSKNNQLDKKTTHEAERTSPKVKISKVKLRAKSAGVNT